MWRFTVCRHWGALFGDVGSLFKNVVVVVHCSLFVDKVAHCLEMVARCIRHCGALLGDGGPLFVVIFAH
jgi:hypothetical protein